MISRCESQSNASYRRYGQRGIRVCRRWRSSFDAFFADMGPRPSPAHSLDRLDSDGDYEPANCRWADATTQARNRSTTRVLTCFGATRSIAEWIEVTGVKRGTLQGRLDAGWPIERALAPRTTRPERAREEARRLFAATRPGPLPGSDLEQGPSEGGAG